MAWRALQKIPESQAILGSIVACAGVTAVFSAFLSHNGGKEVSLARYTFSSKKNINV